SQLTHNEATQLRTPSTSSSQLSSFVMRALQNYGQNSRSSTLLRSYLLQLSYQPTVSSVPFTSSSSGLFLKVRSCEHLPLTLSSRLYSKLGPMNKFTIPPTLSSRPYSRPGSMSDHTASLILGSRSHSS